jgi:hypothetical protein
MFHARLEDVSRAEGGGYRQKEGVLKEGVAKPTRGLAWCIP